MFYIGQKVVCIDDVATGKYTPIGFIPAKDSNLHGLERGQVYTIRNLGVCFDVLVCRVEEITRDEDPLYGEEAWFAQGRFRPVVERKTDISIFTKMLTD